MFVPRPQNCPPLLLECRAWWSISMAAWRGGSVHEAIISRGQRRFPASRLLLCTITKELSINQLNQTVERFWLFIIRNPSPPNNSHSSKKWRRWRRWRRWPLLLPSLPNHLDPSNEKIFRAIHPFTVTQTNSHLAFFQFISMSSNNSC